jgi:hypothetical protein
MIKFFRLGRSAVHRITQRMTAAKLCEKQMNKLTPTAQFPHAVVAFMLFNYIPEFKS